MNIPLATGVADASERIVLDAMPQAVLAVAPSRHIEYANFAAQEFFQTGLKSLQKLTVSELLPGSPVIGLIERCLAEMVSFNEYGLDLPLRHSTNTRMVDLYVTPLGMNEVNMVLMVIQPRSIADHIDRQLTHRGAARSVSGMSAMLAHEIKNPLSGIKGAAQLLEGEIDPQSTELTRLICDETDRIAGLVERFEQFSNAPSDMNMPVNIHAVLENVRLLAANGFARHVRFEEIYDPSLPPVRGNKDMLTQVFINLVKNAAEVLKDLNKNKAEIKLQSAFRPGIHLTPPSKLKERARPLSLPLEFRVIDNGPGVSEDIKAHLFDPFVTTKAGGTGLGVALVAKIIGDHGGTIECNSRYGRTEFCIRLPMVHMGEGHE